MVWKGSAHDSGVFCGDNNYFWGGGERCMIYYIQGLFVSDFLDKADLWWEAHGLWIDLPVFLLAGILITLTIIDKVKKRWKG